MQRWKSYFRSDIETVVGIILIVSGSLQLSGYEIPLISHIVRSVLTEIVGDIPPVTLILTGLSIMGLSTKIADIKNKF